MHKTFVARRVFSEQNVLMIVFGNNLRARAAALQISVAEAARRCGLNERRFANYVLGQREPDLQTLVKIAKALGTKPDVLLGVDDGPHLDDRQRLLDRLVSAAGPLPDADLGVLVIQAEALAAARSSG
jgi:transcriptional regulator with XRE-family HTH domain